jgi:hypothetical protein
MLARDQFDYMGRACIYKIIVDEGQWQGLMKVPGLRVEFDAPDEPVMLSRADPWRGCQEGGHEVTGLAGMRRPRHDVGKSQEGSRLRREGHRRARLLQDGRGMIRQVG